MKLNTEYTGTPVAGQTGSTPIQNLKNNIQVNRQIQSLTPGQTIQGEVLSKNGNEVRIKLADDVVMKATVDRNVNVDVGKTVTFEVRSNGGNLTLSPLFSNTATDANVLKALEMASLPVTDETIAMTEEMMRAGLSVSKNSLQQVFRETNLYPQSPVADIVDLHRLSMPVNETNLSQIASYKNLTHQLVSGLQEIAGEIPQVLQEMVQEGNITGAAQLFKDVLALISDSEMMPAQGDGTLASDDAMSQLIEAADDTVQQTTQQVTQEVAGNGEAAEEIQNLSGNQSAETISEQPTDLQERLRQLFAGIQTEAGQSEESSMTGEESPLVKADTALFAMLDGLGDEGKALSKQIADGQLTVNELVHRLAQLWKDSNGGQSVQTVVGQILSHGIAQKDISLLSAFLGNRDIKNLFTEQLQQKWLIAPEEVADSGKVEELYERLGRQLKGLEKLLDTAGQRDSAAYKATVHMGQNIDFLHQLNQTYTYIQLPLRLQQGAQAHGDLYVYTNKRNLAAKEGPITALLHLDMEHLGPLDVFVSMENAKVNTKFRVQDDSMLDFLSDHMDLLTERLKRRGYDCAFTMESREQEKEAGGQADVVHNLLAQEGKVALVQYAFDVRT